MGYALLPLLYIVLHLAFPSPSWDVAANELSRCCASGARHYRNTQTCTDLRSSSSPTCLHAASVCCLRAVIDAGCAAGVTEANLGDHGSLVCSAGVNDLAGGVRRECCECCLLARELVERGEACRPADGFSLSCVASFNNCCERNQNSTATRSHSVTFTAPTTTVSCDAANCEHFCNLRADGGAECSCRTGYELTEDGKGCVDRDECLLGADSLLSTPTCDPWHEVCVNTPGGYGCRPAFTAASSNPNSLQLRAYSAPLTSISLPTNESCPDGYQRAVSAEEECEDVDECSEDVRGDESCQQDNTQCLNLDGGFSCVCQNGFYWSNAGDVCVDVDECLLLVDDCTETQRCLNTPGSYKCIRTLSCGTGYALDGETESCVDVDECSLSSHDCGALYVCRNTPGSYRCDPKRCSADEELNATSGQCTPLKCSPGYVPKEGRCEDVDECSSGRNECSILEECINTEGSYRCEQRDGNRCGDGFVVDSESGLCVDRDECSDGSHTCGLLQCINLVGSFKCRCPAGFEFDEVTRRCEDVNECRKFAGHTCSQNADCENTVGSFHCHCRPGYRLAQDLRTCEDIDECSTGAARCQHKCLNTPGSYQCMCNRGYQLGMDETSCEDIDECSIWAKSGNDLCMGECVNTHGSFMCRCPPGYELQADGIVCKDIDECAQGACQGSDKLCVNTLGSFKCHAVECPRNYVVDKHYKNRCVRKANFCQPLTAERCKKYAVHISWHHIAIPKQVNLSSQRTSVTLFSMKGPTSPNATMQFELRLVQAVASGAGVVSAVRQNFLLQKGDDHNSAVIALRDSLDGPQEVQLELTLRLSTHGVFNGKYLANLHIHVSQYKPQSHNRHNPLLGHASDAHLGL